MENLLKPTRTEIKKVITAQLYERYLKELEAAKARMNNKVQEIHVEKLEGQKEFDKKYKLKYEKGMAKLIKLAKEIFAKDGMKLGDNCSYYNQDGNVYTRLCFSTKPIATDKLKKLEQEYEILRKEHDKLHSKIPYRESENAHETEVLVRDFLTPEAQELINKAIDISVQSFAQKLKNSN